MRKHLPLILLAASVSLASGCTGMTKNLSSAMPWGKSQIAEGKYQAPVKMAVLWSPAMYTATGKKPTRGFGGRIYFYNAKNEPVPVQGQLVVYCFDDTKKTNDRKQPDRRVAFTPEQFTSHYSPTQLGASYSVWVPWDAMGNEQAEISLLPIFTAATGQVVMGPQSLGLLPGAEGGVLESHVEQRVMSAKDFQNENAKRASFEGDLSAPAFGSKSVESLTISLPEDLAQRVAAASRNPEPQLPSAAEVQPGKTPQNPSRVQENRQSGATVTDAKGSLSGESMRPIPRPVPEQLSHSERIRPRAPVTLRQPPIPYPPAKEPPPEEPPSTHSSQSESGQSN